MRKINLLFLALLFQNVTAMQECQTPAPLQPFALDLTRIVLGITLIGDGVKKFKEGKKAYGLTSVTLGAVSAIWPFYDMANFAYGSYNYRECIRQNRQI